LLDISRILLDVRPHIRYTCSGNRCEKHRRWRTLQPRVVHCSINTESTLPRSGQPNTDRWYQWNDVLYALQTPYKAEDHRWHDTVLVIRWRRSTALDLLLLRSCCSFLAKTAYRLRLDFTQHAACAFERRTKLASVYTTS